MTLEELETRVYRLEQDFRATSESLEHRLRLLQQHIAELDKIVERALSDADWAAMKLKHPSS